MRLFTSFIITMCVATISFATNIDSIANTKSAIAPLENTEVNYSYDLVTFETNTIPVDERLFNYHMSTMEFVIPMDYNPYVKKQIDYFGTRWQKRLKEVITSSSYYFPIYEEILDKHDMPLELRYLSVIESALNPYATSRSGAVGLWQFMPATGRIFDLNQNYIMDERRSIEKSTEAAATYLKSMYKMFGDWYVAIASYNCGPGNVRKAIRRSGRKDFWGMYHFLPRETQNYVPKFIAMAYIMNFYQVYGITPVPPVDIKGPYHPVHCQGEMSFQIISEMLGISKEELMAYNPELKEQVIPRSSNGYWLNIPVDMVDQFYSWESEIQACSKELDLAKKELAAATPKFIYHKVRRGESLGVIARKHRCSVTQLKRWNNLRGSVIHPNQKLKIYRS
ncbi:MAG: transglycosylase SLT domain-containing protein [Bacteroidia bacterium]